jgi:beta-alanine--pyruvate transaminase
VKLTNKALVRAIGSDWLFACGPAAPTLAESEERSFPRLYKWYWMTDRRYPMGHAEPKATMGATAQADLQPYWMPFSANKEFKSEPRMFSRAKGMYFYTPEGREVIDASSGLFCVAAGHCRREIAEAVYEQLQSLDFTAPFLRAHPKAFELAHRIAQHTPSGLNRIFFTNSGSEAVDTAMKIALMFHRVRGQAQRQIFISRERAYHGVNMGGVALAGMVNNRRAFGPGLAGVYHMRHTALAQNRMVRGQPEHGAFLADDLQRFCNLLGGENIAAVFVEPTAGSFGCLPPPKGYLDGLRKICDDNGILLVFDEVITGWGRMGAAFGAQAFGVTPDLLTMAKALTNGAQPMGAVAARQDIYDTITEAGPKQGIEFFHGYTYSAHPAACAAGLAMMDIFRDEQLIERAAATSPMFQDAMHSLADAPGVIDIRSVGMMAGIEVAAVGTPGAKGHALQKALFDRGLHLKSTGDTLIVAPALVAERKHIEEITGKIREALVAAG